MAPGAEDTVTELSKDEPYNLLYREKEKCGFAKGSENRESNAYLKVSVNKSRAFELLNLFL